MTQTNSTIRGETTLTSSDPRWVVLAESGDYSMIGREREPGAAEMLAAEMALERACVGGWVAVMRHSLHDHSRPDFIMVRQIRQASITFDAAVNLLHLKYFPKTS